MRPRTYPDNRVHGVLSELCCTGAKSSCREGEKDQFRDMASRKQQFLLNITNGMGSLASQTMHAWVRKRGGDLEEGNIWLALMTLVILHQGHGPCTCKCRSYRLHLYCLCYKLTTVHNQWQVDLGKPSSVTKAYWKKRPQVCRRSATIVQVMMLTT